MGPSKKREILEELAWHTDRPKVAYEHLTERERADILRVGYVSKPLWAEVEARMPAIEPTLEPLDVDAMAADFLAQAVDS